MFWDLPEDPRAALRWALSKLRPVIDRPDRTRINAERERVELDTANVDVNLWAIHDRMRALDRTPITKLEEMARLFEQTLFDGLNGAGSELFDAWLRSEREDAETSRVGFLRQLATHPDINEVAAKKWRHLWHEADPDAAEAYRAASSALVSGTQAGPQPANAHYRALEAEALKSQRIGYCEVRDGTKIAYAIVETGNPFSKGRKLAHAS